MKIITIDKYIFHTINSLSNRLKYFTDIIKIKNNKIRD